MADEDEDFSFFKGPSAAEIDLSDETQDFRFLSNLSYVLPQPHLTPTHPNIK